VTGVVVNDIHSQLNPTRVAGVAVPQTVEALRDTILHARRSGRCVSIAGGRHAMGGQQFGGGALLIDTRRLNRVIAFDRDRGVVSVDGGIQWPELTDYLEASQRGCARAWGICQKQTGADRLCLGGALSCNAHGRGLTLPPIVGQVEAFDLVGSDGEVRVCSRSRNADLFQLAIGGYGLLGAISRVDLRLRPRVKVRRVVEIADTPGLIERFDDRIREGYLYGDFQFAIDARDDGFLRRGVFSCYQPVSSDVPLTENPKGFSASDWANLTVLSHTDKERAFEMYASRYLETSGQVYWADAQLAASYVDGYHADLDRVLHSAVPGTEMISEIYVERRQLSAFMDDARAMLRSRRADVIYGTIRLIERDDETFLAWARERFACVVFNLHVDHTPAAVAAAAGAFRDLIDLGIAHDGSYYLTYHRWARPDQIERCYPQMRRFLALKRRHDPDEVFQSDWYRHHREVCGRDVSGGAVGQDLAAHPQAFAADAAVVG
jgi:FAD/FMN-containing dehydrogenase